MALVHRMRVAALEQDVGFGAHDEEGRAEREHVEALEIDVAAVHDVERAGLGQDLVEDVDVVHFAVGNADKRGDVAVQVQQRVHLDGGLVLAELGPRKQRQAQVDGGGVQGVQALVQVDADRIAERRAAGRCRSGPARSRHRCASRGDSLASASVVRATLPRKPMW